MHERTVHVGRVELAVAEAGAGGRPLLLMHGFTGAKEDFTEWLDPLAAAGWHAVAHDHRGHGRSSHPDGLDAYSLATLADDAWALIAAFGWDHLVLLGHSMGGGVAQLMAVHAPQRLDGLVLMDTFPGPLTMLDREQVRAAGTIALTDGMDTLAELMGSTPSPLETPAHRRLVDQRPGYAQALDRKLRRTSAFLFAAISEEFLDVPDHLSQLADLPSSLPVLVMAGEQDWPLLDGMRAMAAAIPRARLEIVPDAGHAPQFENPQGWWKVLSTFLAEITSR
jgi:pimeloyl-ACP methyl ester carboxylesterase